jgi:hypothetical protein
MLGWGGNAEQNVIFMQRVPHLKHGVVATKKNKKQNKKTTKVVNEE